MVHSGLGQKKMNGQKQQCDRFNLGNRNFFFNGEGS